MEVFNLLIALIILTMTYWIIKRRKRMSLLKKYGIPGPEPNIFFGNLRELNRKGIHIALQDWEKQYGGTFGYYFGARPIIVITDPELCKQVQIKSFSSFPNRPVIIPGNEKAKFNQHVLRVEGEKWKSQRALITPTFTTGKMKNMFALVNQSIDVLLTKVEAVSERKEEFNIMEYFKGLTLDVIAKAAFGVETNVQNNKNDMFLRGAQDVIREDSFKGLVGIAVCFPEISFIMQILISIVSRINFLFGTDMARAFQNACEDVVMARRRNPENRREDLLQLLVDAEMTQNELKNSSDEHLTAGYDSDVKIGTETAKDTMKNKLGKKIVRLTDEEVMSNTFVMLFAGYETTSTALAFISHVLVNHPEIQEKVRDEIKSIVGEKGEICYETISKMTYLDQVWSETLRYYPPVTTFARRAESEVQYNNLTIPKGVSVQIPVAILHRKPEYWTDPDQFDPDRFSKERRSEINQMAYQPFGGGPRNCIGMRFAQMEAKLALVRLLNEYRLIPSARTEKGDVAVTLKFALMSPKHGVFLKAEKLRSN